MQRNLIAQIMQNPPYRGAALVAFHEETDDDWRFSYVKRGFEFRNGKLHEKLSSPRRHSFLVGPNEPNHTCQKQLLNLLISEEKPLLEEIEEAFSIENVTDEFFNEYKRLFLDLADSLREVKENDNVVSEEFDNRNIKSSDFAKKLMGQLVFIYFLQKKGWLGVEEDADWGTGPKNFLRKIFDECIERGDNFFNDVLEHLFYEGLSEEVADCHYSKFNYKVPFLNGGLFEPINNYDWVKTDVILENSIFKEILDTFDKFNFTVKEDEPLEKEVAVDPEMLGKVFENLLEVTDRKSKGAFYTPRHIVHYMCQENLIAYLNTNSGLSEDDLRVFITKGDSAINSIIRAHEERKKYKGKQFTRIPLPDSIKDNSDELEMLLKKVKVIDPAVGSGAFPVGMMNEIVKARYILRLLNDIEDVNMYDLKRETIENSLYGVDLELSATDVTKLRFWLSLIVDEEDIKHIRPLPNLDNQIMCGNSVIDGYNNIKLFDDSLIVRSEQTRLSMTPTERAFNELESKKREFFNTSGPLRKEELKNEIKELKWNFIETYLKDLGKSELIEEIREFKYAESKPFFIWELEFSEIFKGENPGFDIVIGNPPYVRQEKIKELKPYLKEHYKTFTGVADLYVYFFEKGLNILKEKGIFAFI
ncbi:MAG: Eco57I restriction-modification methylase domain-containing protein, partial [archaeon]|nr:Eco57I restriction-modification methylase domain-containing protein [archaeon]